MAGRSDGQTVSGHRRTQCPPVAAASALVPQADGWKQARMRRILPLSGRGWRVKAASATIPGSGDGGRSRCAGCWLCWLRLARWDGGAAPFRRDARRAGRRQQRLSEHHAARQSAERCPRHGGGPEVVGFEVVEALDADKRKLDGAHAGLHRQARRMPMSRCSSTRGTGCRSACRTTSCRSMPSSSASATSSSRRSSSNSCCARWRSSAKARPPSSSSTPAATIR